MSFSISSSTLNPISRTDVTAGLFGSSPLNHRNVTANIRGSHPEMRLSAYALDQCFEQMRQFSERAGKFLIHFYADTHMFIRSFVTLFGSATREEIDSRINEVRRFKSAISRPRTEDSIAGRRFDRLSEETKNLFFYTTRDYVTQFENETDRASVIKIQVEILRECDRVIVFQDMVGTIADFFRRFTQRSPAGSPGTREGETEPGSLWAWLREWIPVPVEEEGAVPTTAEEGIGSRLRVDLDIPNTVPYNRRTVPADINAKAAEINRLSAAFRGEVPARFLDSVYAGFMKIPVFDASHPAVQNRLAALRTALNDGSSVEDYLNARHHMDHEAMVGHLTAGGAGVSEYDMRHHSAVCPTCRHPVKIDALRIDTGLQDEILAFLRS